MAMQGTTLDSQPNLMTSVAQVKPYRRLDSAGKAIKCSIPNVRSHSPPLLQTPETPGSVRGGIVLSILFSGPVLGISWFVIGGKRKGDQGSVGVTFLAGFLFWSCFIGYRECWGLLGCVVVTGTCIGVSGCIVRLLESVRGTAPTSLTKSWYIRFALFS
ncbi:hypothetical protein V8C44DRAFT_220489 [Trichoderma aethiopicum]